LKNLLFAHHAFFSAKERGTMSAFSVSGIESSSDPTGRLFQSVGKYVETYSVLLRPALKYRPTNSRWTN